MKFIFKSTWTGFLSLLLFACSGASQTVEIEQTVILEKQDDKLLEVEKKVFELVNEYRANHNLIPLTINSEISRIARLHSSKMAEGEVNWGHIGYENRAHQVSSIIAWDEFGENLARNNFNEPASASLESWIQSPMHHDNLIGGFNFTGIGVAMNDEGEYFITQIFIRS